MTPLPKQQLKMMSNVKTKGNMADFHVEDWIVKREETLMPSCELYLSGGFHDIKRAVRVSCGHHHDVPELTANHEDADSWLFLHIAHAKETLGIDRVILWSLDLDVAWMCP